MSLGPSHTGRSSCSLLESMLLTCSRTGCGRDGSLTQRPSASTQKRQINRSRKSAPLTREGKGEGVRVESTQLGSRWEVTLGRIIRRRKGCGPEGGRAGPMKPYCVPSLLYSSHPISRALSRPDVDDSSPTAAATGRGGTTSPWS